MMVVLVVMVRAVPHIMKGKDTGEAMGTMLRMLTWFTVLGGVVVVAGLVVWFRVQKSAKGRSASRSRKAGSESRVNY